MPKLRFVSCTEIQYVFSLCFSLSLSFPLSLSLSLSLSVSFFVFSSLSLFFKER